MKERFVCIHVRKGLRRPYCTLKIERQTLKGKTCTKRVVAEAELCIECICILA